MIGDKLDTLCSSMCHLQLTPPAFVPDSNNEAIILHQIDTHKLLQAHTQQQNVILNQMDCIQSLEIQLNEPKRVDHEVTASSTRGP